MDMRTMLIRRVAEYRASTPPGVGWELNLVEAILQTLREPTPEVLKAGVDNLFAAAHDDWSEDALQIWQAMIDSILNPQKGE